MNRPMKVRRAAALAATLGLTLLGAATVQGAAHAAPKGDLLTVNCDNGHSYNIVSPNSNGRFTPAMATDGTVLVPKAFGETTYSETIDGVPSFSGSDPAVSLAAADHNKNVTVNCTFNGTNTFTDSNGHVYVDTFSGSATVMLAGKR